MLTLKKKLSTKMAENLREELCFNQPCLKPDSGKCNADEYFKEISYLIDLSNLYKVIGTCYSFDEMKYVPILLQIGLEKVRNAYNGYKIKCWAICYQYFVFTLEEGNDDAQYLHLVDLDNKNALIKVANFGQEVDVKYLSYSSEYLYSASSEQVRAMNITKSTFSSEQPQILDASTLTVRTVDPGLTIHGFLLNQYCLDDKYQIVVLETPDNQLDFNKLFLNNFNDSDNYSFKFEQYREIIPRKVVPNDPIVKVCLSMVKGFNFSIALRQSGQVDLYYNMSNMSKRDELQAVNVQDIQITLEGFYFLINGETWEYKHRRQRNLQFNLAVKQEDLEFDDIPLKQVQNQVKLFSGLNIQKYNDSNFAVITHSKFISFYDIFQQNWINHVEFEDEVLTLFRHYKRDGRKHQCILLRNGSVYLSILDYIDYQDPVPTEKRDAKVEGQILRTNEDIENCDTLYITTKQDDKYQLQYLFKGKLLFADFVKDGQANLSATCLQYRGDDTPVLIQNGTKLTMYKQHIQSGNLQVYKTKEYPEFKEITGIIHSVTSYEFEKHLIMFDQKNAYVIKDSKIFVHENIYCIGYQNFSKQYNYAICQETSDSKAGGLRLFDMESIVTKDIFSMTLLKKIDIGALGTFELDFSSWRFGFLKSLKQIIVTPILHRNINKFMGIRDKSEYLCYKVLNDRFIALTVKGELTTWNMLTGKRLTQVTLPDHDYSNYDVQSIYRKDAILIRSKDSVTDFNKHDFFFPHSFVSNTEKQTTFIDSTSYTIKTWKCIEIQNEFSVKVHLEYLHPSYEKQWIFLNKNKDRLIVILTNYRTYAYEKVTIPDQDSHIVKWKIIRQITDYPATLENDAGRLEFFSPDFSRYLIVDRRSGQFIIKDTASDAVLFQVPKELMTVKGDEEPSQVINRFKWLTKEKFLIISEDGIEKIINIDEGFRELQFNWRPLFTEIAGKEYEKNHYYLMREDLGTGENLKRLKRLYQTYKSTYFLYEKRAIKEIYEDLITVDPYKWDHCELSFSFLHWSLIEQLQKGTIKISDLEESVVEAILYNILPGGETVLHKLCEKEEELIKMFQIAHPKEDQIKYHVPFLPDLTGKSPIHVCIQKQDYKSIDTILKYLKVYPTDHHSRAIKNKYADFIEKQLPEFLEYVDSRFQQNLQIQKFTRAYLKDTKKNNGMTTGSIWLEEAQFKQEMFAEKSVDSVESRIKVEILDMPGIYHYHDKDFQDFFSQLATTEVLSFFDKLSIQRLIDFNYRLVKHYVIRNLFAPYCFFHCFFLIFLNIVYSQRTEEPYSYFFIPLVVLLTMFAIYFTRNELLQFKKEGPGYLLSFWNYIDLIPPFGIYVLLVISLLDFFGFDVLNTHVERTVLSMITFFMWFKFLYFLRIFTSFGYLIRMIVEVIYDMRNFFLVLFITIAAFGDSFLALSLGNAETERFTTGFTDSLIYTYRMILGDFATDEFGSMAPTVVLVFFLMCTIFNMIVMLNLLIAIISDSYARVTSSSVQTTYQERAAMIAENGYLIPEQVRENYARKDKFIIVVKDLEVETNEFEDPVLIKFDKMQSKFDKKFTEMKSQIDTVVSTSATQKKEVFDKLSQFKTILLKLAPRIEVQTMVHNHPLVKMTLRQVKDQSNSYTTGFLCDGRNFTGCKSGGLFKKDEKEALYHCDQCNWVFCDMCNTQYPNAHHHSLSKITLEELRQRRAGFEEGWKCDGAKFVECPQGRMLYNDDTAVLYHDKCNFDLCEPCINTFKVQ